jgi:phosphatidylglycerol:prolipoprotein diacylglycerol transferase
VHQRRFFEVTDFVTPAVPIGLALGRIGNFINGELWGRVTDVPWGIVFPLGGPLPRHPSQLYEFALEGLLLFIILWVYSSKHRREGNISGWFLILYGLFRVVVEYFREPDSTHGFIAFGWVTMGQALSFPMILIGIAILYYARHQWISRG